MAAILVDYENVNGSNGLKGADALCADDTLIIFYSNCCGKIRCDYLQDIKDSGCEFRVVKLCIGVGQHKSCRVLPNRRPQLLQIHTPVFPGRYADYFITAHGRAGRVGAVG